MTCGSDGFLVEGVDSSVLLNAHQAEPGSVAGLHRHGTDGDLGRLLLVSPNDFAEIHPVELVSGQDQEVVDAVGENVSQGLAHRVRRSLKPAAAVRGLLGCQNVHEPAREHPHLIGHLDVGVQRGRIVLSENKNLNDSGVNAVTDGDVDQPVLAGQRNRRFGAHGSQGKKPRSLAASEYDSNGFFHLASVYRSPTSFSRAWRVGPSVSIPRHSISAFRA